MAKTLQHDVRKLPAPESGGRVETGPTQFGDDWPGIFIRGDNALIGFAPGLREIMNYIDEDEVTNSFAIYEVIELINLLESCAVKPE